MRQLSGVQRRIRVEVAGDLFHEIVQLCSFGQLSIIRVSQCALSFP
jgi:hypothetical protein